MAAPKHAPANRGTMTLQQHTSPLSSEVSNHSQSAPSIVHGPSYPPLVTLTLADFLDLQCRRHGPKECLIIPWTGTRWTYNDIYQQSIAIAKVLVEVGVQVGDRIGIMAGNCEQYIAVLFAAARIGAILVVLNNTYTASEALRALQHTECRILFTTTKLGALDNSPLLSQLMRDPRLAPRLEEIIILYGNDAGFRTYEEVSTIGSNLPDAVLDEVDGAVSTNNICMLLFTSGSTGAPKAASLTHLGVLNNARFIGMRLNLTTADVLVCPPPLFHCFGLVLGLLATMTHGAKIIFPGEVFDPHATLRAIALENATVLHGVPAMFDTILSLPRDGLNLCSLRTGIIAGSPVPRHLMEKMSSELGMTQWTSSYGLTEASPTCFNSTACDSIHRKLTTVGRIMPHAHAKIIDRDGHIVPIGTRGELCVAGYQLQAGYWRNNEKTAEAMVRDEDGVLWLRTGDEAVFDEEGYCSITGRFKDLIIRGGENIYPLEIEDRLVAHPSIDRAVVVGIRHPRLIEVVGAFLQRKDGHTRPDDAEIKDWTRRALGRHKCPEHIFWLGEDGITSEIPLTGSGKIQKFVMRALAEKLLFGFAEPARL